MSNVIAFPANSRSDDHKITTLGERLKTCGRLTAEDKRICSLNLGRIAERLKPDLPLLGARMIFAEAGEDFAKRQRWITLPGESPHAVLGATGGTWLGLANAAGRLSAEASGAISSAASEDRALMQLLRGTSFLPIYVPTNDEQASRKALADGYAKALCDAVANDRALQRLWSVLQVFPFAIEARRESSSMDQADRVPDDWTDVQYPPNDWRFCASAKADTDWSRPRMDIGCVVLKRSTKIFILPSSVTGAFRLQNEDEDGNAPTSVYDDLAASGITMRNGYTCAELGDLLPDESYDPAKGFGWTPATAYDFARVRLKIVPDENEAPKAVIDYYSNRQGTYVDLRGVNGVVGCSQSIDEILHFQARNRNGRKTFANTRDAWIGEEWINGMLVFTEAHDVYDRSLDATPVAITEPTYNWDTPEHLELDTDTVLDWCDTPGWAEMMLTDTYRFVPAFEVSGRGTPFPSGSIAHALFSNLNLTDSDKRLDRAFLRHVRRTAQIGLEWYGGLIDEAQSALESIKAD
jgi:hypothetical protein